VRTLFFLGGASVLSGLEARLRFGVRAADSFLLASPRAMRSGVDLLPWAATALATSKPRGGRGVAWLLAEISAIGGFVARHGPFGRVVLGDLGHGMRLAAAATAPAEVVVVDDGLGGVVVAEHRRKGVEGGAAFLEPPRVTFFSAFDVIGRPGDPVVFNDYRHFRARIGRPVDESWVIGQPLVEGGMVTSETYTSMLGRMLDDGLPGSVVYIAHPNENETTARRSASTIGAAYRRLDRAVEFEALARRPHHVVGACSSALPQIAQLLSTSVRVRSYAVDPAAVLRNHERVFLAYDAIARVTRACPSLTMVACAERSALRHGSTEGGDA